MPKLPPWLVPVIFCAGGLVMAHHPMMKDGLGFIQFDWGDTRFVNFMLEHTWQWVLRNPAHAELWSPPFFYPVEGHLAWSENMFGGVPFYAPWRILGFDVATAFQLWVMTLGALNFTAAYYFFRRCLKVDGFAASAAAALFAFAGMRINQTMHYQLFPQFFSIWAVHACWRLAVDFKALTERQRTFWLVVLFASVTWQILVGIYLGWFLIFGLAVAGGIGLLYRDGRERIWFVLKSHPFTIALLSAVCLTLLLPVGLRYAGTAEEFGGRPFEEALTMIPEPRAWLHFGPYSWWYAGLEKFPMFQKIVMSHEQRIGFGIVTSLLCFVGMYFSRRDRALAFVGMVLVLLFAFTTLWGDYPEGFTAWKYIWGYFPGAKAIRGVARVALLYLIGVSMFTAVAIHHLRAMGSKLAVLGVLLGLASVIEQGETTPAFSKKDQTVDLEEISAAIPADCEVFFFSPIDARGPYWKYQLDAMLVALSRGIPTLNGYSGQSPAGYPLGDPVIHSPGHEQALARAAQAWVNEKKITKKVCWAKVGLQEGPAKSKFIAQQVPTSLIAGQRASVTLKFKNIGEETWDPAQNFRLGSQAPRDSTTWGMNRVQLPRAVKPGDEVEIPFEVAAPAEPGKYAFSFRLVHEMVAWFGNASSPVEIEVTAPPP